MLYYNSVMNEELQPDELRREKLKQQIENAKHHLLPIAEHQRMSSEQAPREKGYVEVSTLKELREALVISRETGFPKITDEWIDFEVEHEEQHANEAKRIYGKDVSQSYGIQFLEMENGQIALVPMHIVGVPPNIDKDTFLQNAVKITRAPKHHSHGDKTFLQSQPTPPSHNHRGE